MRPPVATAIFLLLAPTLIAGCALNCLEVGCSGSYELTFVQDGWDDGDYVLTVKFEEGEPQRCEFTLPLDGETPCGPGSIAFDGAELVAAVHTGMGQDVEHAEVMLEFGRSILLDEEVMPEWSEPFYPNGEACDRDSGGCVSAEDRFTL